MTFSVVLITRAMPAANALVRRLQEASRLEAIVCERMAVRTPPAEPRERVTALADRALRKLERLRDKVEDLLEPRAIERVFGSRAAPLTDPPPIHYVANKAWDEALPLLERTRPDVIVVFGTSLLPESVTALAARAAINLHVGLAPYYRGNNCVPFAIINDDIENVGATLHLVRPGIDTGEIVTQGRPDVRALDDEHILAAKVQDLSHRLLIDVLGRGAFDAQPQPSGVGNLYLSSAYTQGHRDLVRRLVREGAIERYVARSARGRTRPKPIVTTGR